MRTPDRDIEPYQILVRVLQGGTLAPFLFIATLDYALRCTTSGKEEELVFTLVKRASRRVPAKTMTNIDFADDISLMSNTAEQACKLLTEVERHCNRIGLGLNAKKTIIMAKNVNDPSVTTLDSTFSRWFRTSNIFGAGSLRHSMTWRSEELEPVKPFIALTKCRSQYWAISWNAACFLQQLRAYYCMGPRRGLLLDRMRKYWLESTHRCSVALNVSWEDHVGNIDLYDNLPRLSEKSRQRWRDSLGTVCGTHNSLQMSSSSGSLFMVREPEVDNTQPFLVFSRGTQGWEVLLR